MKVTLYGPNTKVCHRAEVVLRQTLKAMGASVELEMVRDTAHIRAAHVTAPPEIEVDGHIVSCGRVPTSAEVVAWLDLH
ncbi:thioredoxin family protein [Chitiniphilus eburneus]|uniref:Thioredoxin family protein n=1 Tax=Chitiniphilus eburneus TaxID=2571148 RepID=A0A4U0Q3S9_9NEIS|nr:thioredoxin family protein [Chitiniphilus eburneus]TJZ75649.1 thioredoxin family protein [Chitiniphilus eburneus]